MGVRVEDILVAGLDMPLLTAVQLDYHPPLARIRRLAERTHIAPEAIRAMTVQSYVPLLLDRLDAPHGPAADLHRSALVLRRTREP